MKIYDYYDDYAFSSIIFVIISIACIIALAIQVISLIKSFYKARVGKGVLLLFCPVIITLVLTSFISSRTFNLIKFDVTCKTGNYESVVGELQVVSVERNDYRDVKQYDIVFSVNGMVFDNINSFSETQKD